MYYAWMMENANIGIKHPGFSVLVISGLRWNKMGHFKSGDHRKQNISYGITKEYSGKEIEKG